MKLVARVIIQMMGAPKKHIEDTLKKYIAKIDEDYADIKVLKKYISPAKKEGGHFNVFSELELEIEGTENLVWFCFDYMPASVEILEPDSLVYECHDFTNFLNDLQQKLHKVDMMIKSLSAENQVLKKNGMTLMNNILLLQLGTGPKNVSALAKGSGVPEDHVEKFLESMVTEGKIKKHKDTYRLS
jgi:hypothetical protein